MAAHSHVPIRRVLSSLHLPGMESALGATVEDLRPNLGPEVPAVISGKIMLTHELGT